MKGSTDPSADLKVDEKMDTQENDSVRQRRLRHDGNQALTPVEKQGYRVRNILEKMNIIPKKVK